MSISRVSDIEQFWLGGYSGQWNMNPASRGGGQLLVYLGKYAQRWGGIWIRPKTVSISWRFGHSAEATSSEGLETIMECSCS